MAEALLAALAARRRGGVDAEVDPVELCCILVHTAQGGAETRLATLLAAWLHWFGRLDLHQAMQARRPSPFHMLALLNAVLHRQL